MEGRLRPALLSESYQGRELMSSLHSKTLFASFAVMAVVAAAFAGISVFGEDADAATDTGTELSPLSSVSGDALTYTNLDI